MNKTGSETVSAGKSAGKRPFSFSSGLKVTLVVAICILINCAGGLIASNYNIPGWLDTYGLMIASYLYGPIPGALTGIASNVILTIMGSGSIPYALVCVFLGFAVGTLARKGYFNTIFHTMTVAAAASTGSVIISSIINICLEGGNIGNEWGDAVRDYLIEAGLHRNMAVLIGQFYLDFPDKLAAAFFLYLVLKAYRLIKKHGKKKLAEQTASVSAAVVMLICCCAPGADIKAGAEQPEGHISYIQTVFDSMNGLLCGHANAIAQTSDGVLWIGTYAGLYRYNGSEFVHMSGLSDVRNVNCLYVDNEGRLWIGTNDNGIAIVIDGKTVNVINSTDGLPSDSIRSIVQSASGEYFIGTTEGLVTLELKMGISVKEKFSFTGNIDKLAADSKGKAAALDRDGTLYIFERGMSTKTFSLANEGKQISCCNFAEDGTLYLGTNDGYVYKYLIENGSAERKKRIACNGISKVNNIYPDKDNFTKQSAGDFDHSVENMEADYQGNLWFASSRLGLLRLTRSGIKDIYTDTGLKSNVVNATAVFGGLLYAGEDDGLRIIDPEKNITISNDLTGRMSGSRIRSMMCDSNGHLWICSYGEGLVKAVGSSEGLFFFKAGACRGSIPFSDSFGYSQVLCLMETPDGTLYAGTDGNGIVIVDTSGPIGNLSKKDGLTSEVILRMVYDNEDGSIYIVTSNSVCRLANGSIEQLEAIPYSNNYDLILDGDEVFVPGSSGIYVFNKKQLLAGSTGEPLLINFRMGLIGSLTANAWNAVDEHRNLYLSADRGVFMINLDNYLLNQRACRLRVAEIRLDDEPESIERGTELTVPRDITKIEFIPEIINYTYTDPTISYMLEGFDTAWNTVQQSELVNVTYMNLKPGEYSFHLAIFDSDNNILEESTYSIVKEKALYDNAWFRYYMIGVAAVFIGWLTWFITRTQIQHTLTLQQTKLQMALQQVQMGNETILAIAKTVDAKDLRTSKHSQRVSEYSAMIAREYGFPEKDCENLRQAALLHDIGKIAIPDSVLNKPGRLTDEEYAVMKTHVTRGSEILKDFTLIDHVVEGARYHHERYDGRGYPDGLKGEEIPLYGRIIAIADAFDAMTANRVYRKRQDFDYVMGELHKGRGTQFDPELLDIFLKLIDDKKIDIDALYSENAQKGEE